MAPGHGWQFVLAAVLSIAPALAAPATQAPSQGTAAPEGETISTVQADAHREQAPDSADADADAVSGEPADPADAVRKAALEAEAGETAHDAQTDNDPVESAHEAGGAPTVVTSAELDKEAEGAEAAPAADEPAGIAGEVAADNGPDTHWPVKQGPMPYEIVRSLQFLQDQIARGNVPALKVQAMLLRRYGPTFSEADASVWKDGRNLRAAVLFVLSGGSPSALRWIMAKTDLKGDNRTLFEGALAYMDNDVATAESKLSSLDLTFVESSLAAQIDLVIAQLQQNTKPREALGRLSKVMVTAPGTLLDEAALRMGVILAEDLGERRLSDQFVRQYFDRYSRSAYAGNFRARFAAIYAERPIGTEDDTMATIKDATAMLPADQQLALYLAVGRRALINGNLVPGCEGRRQGTHLSGHGRGRSPARLALRGRRDADQARFRGGRRDARRHRPRQASSGRCQVALCRSRCRRADAPAASRRRQTRSASGHRC